MMDKLSEVDYVPNPQLAKVSLLLLPRLLLLLLFSTLRLKISHAHSLILSQGLNCITTAFYFGQDTE
jgi:citrate synthase